MMSYPQLTEEKILWELNLDKAWWLWSCAVSKFGSAMWSVKVSNGYIKRETDKLKKQQYDYWKSSEK
jgi:hypothetical protein